MRGSDIQQSKMFSYLSPESRVPQTHPLRSIRIIADKALKKLSPVFKELYSKLGRPSIPPEHLLRSLLLQILYSIRSERLLVEQLAQSICSQAETAGLLSDDHFTVDGTLIKTWASLKRKVRTVRTGEESQRTTEPKLVTI